MRAIFLGTPRSVVPTLERLSRLPEVDVVAAVTQPDRERGRGRRSEPPPVKEAANNLGIPVMQPDSLRSQGSQDQLAEWNPDVIVVAAYGKFLPAKVLEIPHYGCLNLHPSLLPLHRGPSPVVSAILDGDEVTGVSLMLLDEGMDTGPLIARREYTVSGEETAGGLTETLFEMGAELLAERLGPWVRGELRAYPQYGANATVSRKLERTDGLADWNLSAESVARRCRAYNPWPGLYSFWDTKMLKLLEVSPVPQTDLGAELGRVVYDSSSGLPAVGTGDGLLALGRLQLEGRRAVTAREFLAGHPDFVGSVLGNQ